MIKLITTGPYPGHPGAHMAHFNINNHNYNHSHDLNHYHSNNNHNDNHHPNHYHSNNNYNDNHHPMKGYYQQPIQTWIQPMVPFTPFMF